MWHVSHLSVSVCVCVSLSCIWRARVCMCVCVCLSSPISPFLSIRSLFSTNLLASRSPRCPRPLTLRYVSASSGRGSSHLPPIRLQSFPQTPPPHSAWLLPFLLRPHSHLSVRFIENQMIPFHVFVCVCQRCILGSPRGAGECGIFWEVTGSLFLQL